MKALHDSPQDAQDQRAVMELVARVAGIFERYPMLCGFSVQERSTLTWRHAMVQLQGGLCVVDVTVSTPYGFHVTHDFCKQIAHPLLELIDEQPEVCGLLPGRTFARTLH
jgi:hypothetical protein